MTFRDLLNNDQLILVVCHDCTGKMPVDPAPPALEFGIDANVMELCGRQACPACGSADVTLTAFSPIAMREGGAGARGADVFTS